MFKHLLIIGLCGFIACDGAVERNYLSLVAIESGAGGSALYVAASSGQKIISFDVESEKVTAQWPLEFEPSGLVADPSNEWIYVTGGGDQGVVVRLNVCSGEVDKRVRVGHTPGAPVLAPDGGTLYVCNRFNHDVSIIDVASGQTVARVPVAREPIAADLTPDGRYLFVANHIPEGPADVEYVAAEISVIDTRTREVTSIPLMNGAEGLRGLKVSPDGQYVFATHLVARFQVPVTQVDRGWVSTSALSVIQVSNLSLLHTVLLDDIDLGFSNPWAIDFTADGKNLLVTSAGNHELALIDLPAMLRKIEDEKAVENSSDQDVYNNLSFLFGIRQRIPLNGQGPRALIVSGRKAYVAHYFSDQLDVVDFSTPRDVLSKSVPLGPRLPLTAERQGEMLFNDASICFQSWLSCATCHPDARTDALNWDLLHDGMGNPKNAKSMLLVQETPRSMWLGEYDDLATCVRNEIKNVLFAVLPESDVQAMIAYIKSLKPIPSPYLVDGEFSHSARRGEKVFERIGCGYCHSKPLFTDLELRDVESTRGADIEELLDTPTLIEVWRTAPYLHDGRAATIDELIREHAHADTSGRTADLNEREIADLVEYILSL
jgi:YVTN family beta-propeller protein